LRVGGLADDAADGRRVPRQGVDVDFGPHIPHSGGRIAAASKLAAKFVKLLYSFVTDGGVK